LHPKKWVTKPGDEVGEFLGDVFFGPPKGAQIRVTKLGDKMGEFLGDVFFWTPKRGPNQGDKTG
jgi:hypothetical protein